MTNDAPVDGNALAGPLMLLFGREMTDARCCCAVCNEVHRVGALHVYDRAPGSVARCPSCDSVMLVATERDRHMRFHFAAFRWVETIER